MIAAAAASTSGASVLVRFVLAMAVVFGLIALMAKVGKGRGVNKLTGRARRSGQIVVVSRQTFGKGISVALVRVGEKEVLIGVTPHGVNLLSEMDMDPELEAIGVGAGVSQAELLPAFAGRGSKGGQWRTPLSGGGSSPKAWMTKLEQLREMTVRRA